MAATQPGVNLCAEVGKLLTMKTTHYIAETDGENAVNSVWIMTKGRKNARVFDVSHDRFDPSKPAQFSGASEAEITRWLLARAQTPSD